MIESMVCKKQISLLDVILNMFFVLTLVLKSTTFSEFTYLAYFEMIMLYHLYLHISKPRNLLLSVTKNNKPIRSTILNFNKLVSDLDTETSSPDS